MPCAAAAEVSAWCHSLQMLMPPPFPSLPFLYSSLELGGQHEHVELKRPKSIQSYYWPNGLFVIYDVEDTWKLSFDTRFSVSSA